MGTKPKSRLLILDDEVSICVSLSLALEREYNVEWETDPKKALELLQVKPYDLVLLDMVIGDCDGLEVLESIKKIDKQIAVIVMTAYGSIHSSVTAMKKGAFTYLSKPLDVEELVAHIDQALEFSSLNKKVSSMTDAFTTSYSYGGMVGKSLAMQRVYKMIDKVKDVDASVTITGESGTGKEPVAKAIHFSGKRKNERFVAVNCSAIPEGLLEEEFFGHKRGSFTGAVENNRGKFEVADKGTLFLDEIGDMPPNLQGKLLRALQEKSFSPIGSHDIREFDVRVIAATNQDLKTMVQDGRFRQDLYYRINVVEIDLPPLRERKEDILLLCDHFLKADSPDSVIKGLTKEAKRALLSYDYPGNVRELANMLEYASIVSEDGWISLENLPGLASGQENTSGQSRSLEERLTGLTLKELERIAITASFNRHSGKRKAIAAELAISERSLWNKLNEYGLQK